MPNPFYKTKPTQHDEDQDSADFLEQLAPPPSVNKIEDPLGDKVITINKDTEMHVWYTSAGTKIDHLEFHAEVKTVTASGQTTFKLQETVDVFDQMIGDRVKEQIEVANQTLKAPLQKEAKK